MTLNLVVASAPTEHIITSAPDNLVIPRTAVEYVITGEAVKMINPIATTQGINAFTTDYFIVTGAAVDGVIAISCRDQFGTICSGEGVVAIGQDFDRRIRKVR